jgi:Ran GTPase-activating protein (RanGAP) involved in mRNA processing and transport
MAHNRLCGVGIETLMFSIKTNQNLVFLDFSYNQIVGTITFVIALAELIKANKCLKVLYLHGNKYGFEFLLID